MTDDPNLELAQRTARMIAAKADKGRTSSPVIAAMAAGAGARLVAGTYAARQKLAVTIEKQRGARERGEPLIIPVKGKRQIVIHRR